MTKPYDPLSGRRPTKTMLLAAAKEEVGCERVRLSGLPQLDYCAFFADAEERAKRGETQKRCLKCLRFRWADQAAVCQDFKEDVSA